MDGLIVVKNEKESIFDILDMQEDIVDGKIKPQKVFKENKKLEENIELKSYGRQAINGSKSILTKEILFGLAVHYCLEMIEEFSIEFLDSAIEVTKVDFS